MASASPSTSSSPSSTPPTRFGGRRQWLSCLKCGMACRKIYGGRYFRQCHGLVHASTREPSRRSRSACAGKLTAASRRNTGTCRIGGRWAPWPDSALGSDHRGATFAGRRSAGCEVGRGTLDARLCANRQRSRNARAACQGGADEVISTADPAIRRRVPADRHPSPARSSKTR